MLCAKCCNSNMGSSVTISQSMTFVHDDTPDLIRPGRMIKIVFSFFPGTGIG